jgi:hypothetical protein
MNWGQVHIKSRIRKRRSGEEVGGITFMAGPLSHILGNRVYLGEINHRDKSYPGEHDPLISKEQFDRVQEIRRSHSIDHDGSYKASGALLTGLIYDDRGNRMSPTHVKKGNMRYHYYQSSVLAHGLKSKAGSVERVPAAEIEKVVVATAHEHIALKTGSADGRSVQIRDIVDRVEVHPSSLKITLKSIADEAAEAAVKTINIPWVKPSNIRKREILGNQSPTTVRPIKSEARRRLLKGIAQGQRWLEMLITKRAPDLASLAAQHDISEKTLRSTISLAFLAPDIVQAVIDGKLPRGLGVTQMNNLSPDWSEQRRQLGIG